MKLHINEIGGEVVKDNEVYLLKDNKTLKNLIVSSTCLRPGMSTRGHSHVGQEEVYYFVSGSGTMELISGDEKDYRRFPVNPGDVVLIQDGYFHKVFNTLGEVPLYFVCVFDGGQRNH